MSLRRLFFLLIISISNFAASSQTGRVTQTASATGNLNSLQGTAIGFKDCAAYLKGDSLILENSLIKRMFLFNHGNLSSYSLLNKRSGSDWILEGGLPDFSIPGMMMSPSDATFKIQNIMETPQQASHLEAEVIVFYGDLQVKRVFRIYPSTPAIACDTYLKGDASDWQQLVRRLNGMGNKESRGTSSQSNTVVMDHLSFEGRNWKVKSVEFFDATDKNNTLVQEYPRTSYKSEVELRGNLLLMEEVSSQEGLFWLKEAPVSAAQLDYPGFDFSIKFNDFKAVGIGIAPSDISGKEWVRGYSIVIGVAAGGEEGARIALRTYQQNIKPVDTESDNMIMLNTWGDRGQGKDMSESFILNEMSLGSKLGITHLQMDAGWESGRSSSSVLPGESLDNIWHDAAYWKINPVKFPDGFEKIIAAAKKNNIVISTWFNPSIDSSFKNWRKDASVLINQYKDYGIHTWKIDGVRIADKRAETNFRKMLDTVVTSTHHEAVFNLDVTAGRRFGYNYFYEYGNLFLENRYTDFGNYYPHFTLRNLWMLSKYMPPQRLQIEFLNKWRNLDKYPKKDPFAPEHYSFDYLFAVTMPAQPLAWMELRNLPEQAFHLSILIKTYKKYWHEWHSGQIFPIGEEPSGISWTGFQSILKDKASGYVLIFRETTPMKEMTCKLAQLPVGRYVFQLLAGNGKSFNATTCIDGLVRFILPNERNFAFYRYHLIE